MKVTEIISSKIEELLGDNYKVFPVSHFNKNYTEAREIREGENVSYLRQTTTQYGEFRKNKVVGVLTLQGATRSNVSGFYLSTTYQIQFSVPRNINITNKYDVLTQKNAFDFDEDIETLINTIINSKIDFTAKYKGKMTISEPTYVLTETDGEFYYDIMQINGTIVISDNANFGGDYKVAIKVNEEYVELDGINTYDEVLSSDANAIVKQGKAKLEQNLAQTGWVCTFSIDDIETENLARQKIYEIIHNNLEIVNNNGINEAMKRKLPVKITTPKGNEHSFNAIVGISFSTTQNGVGSYDISFTDDNKG